jgi:hypothetical protein
MSDLCECGILKSECTHPNCSDAEKEFDSKILANGIKPKAYLLLRTILTDTSSKKLQEEEQKGND